MSRHGGIARLRSCLALRTTCVSFFWGRALLARVVRNLADFFVLLLVVVGIGFGDRRVVCWLHFGGVVGGKTYL